MGLCPGFGHMQVILLDNAKLWMDGNLTLKEANHLY